MLKLNVALIARQTLDISGRDVFELSADSHHDHILCLDCSEVFEFKSPKIESLQDEVARVLKFTPQGHRHVIHGHCEYIKSKTAKTR